MYKKKPLKQGKRAVKAAPTNVVGPVGQTEYVTYATWGNSLLDEGYTPIPNALYENFAKIGIESEKLSVTDVGFIGVLFSFKRSKGLFPRIATIAQRAGMTERGVQKKLAKLERLGCLKRVQRRSESGSFISNVLDFSPLRKKLEGTVNKLTPAGEQMDTSPGEQMDTRGGVPDVPLAQVQSGSGRSPSRGSNIDAKASIAFDFKNSNAIDNESPEKDAWGTFSGEQDKDAVQQSIQVQPDNSSEAGPGLKEPGEVKLPEFKSVEEAAKYYGLV